MKLLLYKYDNFKYIIFTLLFIIFNVIYVVDYNKSIDDLTGDNSIVVEDKEEKRNYKINIGDDFEYIEDKSQNKVNAYGNREMQRSIRDAQKEVQRQNNSK